jgi:hypothetical protein
VYLNPFPIPNRYPKPFSKNKPNVSKITPLQIMESNLGMFRNFLKKRENVYYGRKTSWDG